MEKLYHKKPDIDAWVNMIRERADVREITFFADFSNESLNKEILKIREHTNKIVETRNANPHTEKDFTDFIMLDHIYQKAFAEDKTDIFILFTGDAHFNSVAAFLKTICGKQVGVYGVKGAFSSQLKSTASWWVEIPSEIDVLKPYYDMILKNIKFVEHNSKDNQRISFKNTVDNVSEYYSVDKNHIQTALQSLVDQGYIERHDEFIHRKRIMTLHTNWDKLTNDGIWIPESMKSSNLFVKKSAKPQPIHQQKKRNNKKGD